MPDICLICWSQLWSGISLTVTTKRLAFSDEQIQLLAFTQSMSFPKKYVEKFLRGLFADDAKYQSVAYLNHYILCEMSCCVSLETCSLVGGSDLSKYQQVNVNFEISRV